MQRLTQYSLFIDKVKKKPDLKTGITIFCFFKSKVRFYFKVVKVRARVGRCGVRELEAGVEASDRSDQVDKQRDRQERRSGEARLAGRAREHEIDGLAISFDH